MPELFLVKPVIDGEYLDGELPVLRELDMPSLQGFHVDVTCFCESISEVCLCRLKKNRRYYLITGTSR
jgi:hypothetical protein